MGSFAWLSAAISSGLIMFTRFLSDSEGSRDWWITEALSDGSISEFNLDERRESIRES